MPQGVPISNGNGGPSQQITNGSYVPLGYPPGLYGQYSPLLSKPSDGLPTLPMYSNPPYFLSSVPHVQPQMDASEGDSNAYPTQAFYPTPVFTPVAYHHPQYVSRLDGQGPIPMQYSVYARQSLGAGQDEIQHVSGSARNEEQDRVSSKADSEIRTI